jgi:hypothetical protein
MSSERIGRPTILAVIRGGRVDEVEVRPGERQSYAA